MAIMQRLLRSLFALSLVASMAAHANEIIVIQGTTSMPNEAERNYARRTSELLSRWLQEVGIDHDVVVEEDLGPRSLRGCKLAILGYNPQPTPRTLRQLRQLRRINAKLIVCYGGHPQLAALMGVELGAYRQATRPGQWSGFRFQGDAVPHLPDRVAQSSGNIRLVSPMQGRSRVIATWEDRAGRSTGDPAWLMSDAGFWMTHVLRDDGDSAGKQQMLLAMIASAAPSVWRDTAKDSLAKVGVIGRFRGLHMFVEQVDRLARIRGLEKDVSQNLAKAQALYARAQHLQRMGQHAAVVDRCREINHLLIQAYGDVQSPVHPEVRAVWEHTGAGLYPGDWSKTVHVLASHGFTDLIVNVLWPGFAHYDSRLVPASDLADQQGDQLAACLAAAKRAGVRVHAWKVCWNLDRAAPDFIAKMRRDGRLQMTDTGEVVDWLCPSDPRNLKFEKDAVRELVGRYDVDGIHLDYIRMRDWHTCYCGGCRKRFETWSRTELAQWPGDVKKGKLRVRFLQWRAAIITRYVEDVSVFARKRRPDIKISAAVFGKYPQCVGSVGQDWALWLKKGYVDFVCPMNYTAELRRYAGYLDAQLKLPNTSGRIYPGIGVNARESRLSAVDVIDQIRLTRRTKAGGFTLFDLDGRLETEILPILKRGVTRE